jgi:orotidine-5'-phosphate decarboxylase
MTDSIDYRQRIIVALDVENGEQGLALVRELKDARVFKVGLELFTAEGPQLLRDIKAMGKDVFLDLKLHDIPNTVGEAVRIGVRHGVRMMTIHASGGFEMMAKAADVARSESEKRHTPKPLLLGVTILTSLKNEELGSIGMIADTAAQVSRLAGLAKKAGMDGVVCSAQEIEIVRKDAGPEFLIVTPGIRPAWAAAQDQKRIMTPAQAIAKGSDYLVVGRPITQAPAPQEAFLRVWEEINPFDSPG